MGTEHVVSSNPTTTESTVNCLGLHSLASNLRRRRAIAHAAMYQLLKMKSEVVPHFPSGAETVLSFVFDGAHKDLLHLSRYRRSYLARSGVLAEIEDQH